VDTEQSLREDQHARLAELVPERKRWDGAKTAAS
jgi:hypothetical protein